MAGPAREDVERALAAVADPATGKSVIASGLVQGLAVRDGHVSFVIEVPAERGPSSEPLRQICEETVGKLPGVLSVTAVLTAHRARGDGAGAPKPQAAPDGHRGAPTPVALPGVAAIVAVASGKGGVGKSTVAVNLALGLARLGLKTGLLDADIYGPSVPRLLDIRERPRVNDAKKLVPLEKSGLKTMSIGYFLDEDAPAIMRGPRVMAAVNQMLGDVAWAPLDVLVVDMPPGTGDAQLTLVQRVPLAGAVIVSTPQDLALIDARKAIAMFRKTGVPILGIVENMSAFLCPHCGYESHIFGHGGARDTATALACDFLGEIPLVLAIREGSDGGRPVVAATPESAEAKAFLDIAAAVADKLADRISRHAG